jgi:cephalosporin-C deacetylase-like acetyl esterase
MACKQFRSEGFSVFFKYLNEKCSITYSCLVMIINSWQLYRVLFSGVKGNTVLGKYITEVGAGTSSSFRKRLGTPSGLFS